MPPRKAADAQATDRQLAAVQSATTEQELQLPVDKRVTEVPDGREDQKPGLYAELAGEKFRLSEETGFMALMEWAAAGDGEANEGAAIGANLRAMYHLLEDLVAEEEWPRFRAHARREKCRYEQFKAFQDVAFEALSGNPTE